MKIKEIIDRLEYIFDDSDGNLCDEDIKALKEAVFWLRYRCLDKIKPDDGRIFNLREYAANNVGKKVFIEFDCTDITIYGSEKTYQKDVTRLKNQYPDGIFTIIDASSLQSDDNEDLSMDVGHNFISCAYEYMEDDKNERN